MASSETELVELQQTQAVRSTGADALDITACDREPIHLAGAIQPHGLLLIADAETLQVVGGAGALAERLTPAWLERDVGTLLAQDVRGAMRDAEPGAPVRLALVPGRHEPLQPFAAFSGGHLLVWLEAAPDRPQSAAAILGQLDAAGSSFERASDLAALCTRAAVIFREITGFDRVMIYRFLDDGAGLVIAEDRAPRLGAFLNHHFPASDIPKQARLLYVRNRVRVIPDVDYEPLPIAPAELAQVDLTDVGVRSVSPIHLQYLRNMGVRASASISIVKDGLLWGLVACHHDSPRMLSHETLSACSALAGGLARQIRSREEAELYRDRIRLRAVEDAVLGRIDADQPLEPSLATLASDVQAMLAGDGFAVVSAAGITTHGVCPPDAALAELARWLAPRSAAEPFVSRTLGAAYPAAAAWEERASGLLAVTVGGEQPIQLLWFRAEERERVEWAGNPHKGSNADPQAMLTPRSSFETWTEEVRGQARPWTLAQIEGASRFRRQLLEARQSRRLRELNRELAATVAEKDGLIAQKDHLLREVNHRVQNSLQLVQAFLALQERAGGEGEAAAQLQEAQRRISAVALVHRRLYQAEQVEVVDLGRYLEELIAETRTAMGSDWSAGLTLDLAPILISADRAVNVGLVLTELVINANKYAYGGESGPIAISLEEYRNQFRLIVADQGTGAKTTREGFGTRMMKAMVARLDGTIERFDNKPGLRVIVTAPLEG